MSEFHDSRVLRQRLDAATADLAPPFAVVDMDAFSANGAAMRQLAGDTPIRIASKSLRCLALLRRCLAMPNNRGILALSLAEALWLVENDISDDIVVGYPTADHVALTALASNDAAAAAITLMIDDTRQLDFIDSVVPSHRRGNLRVCIELDASLRLAGGRAHIGVRRSPVHKPIDAVRLAKAVVARNGYSLVGLMSYEAQIAGIPQGYGPASSAIRFMQHRSFAELRRRRALTAAAVRHVAELEFVNGAGTGSLAISAADHSVSEFTAGSGYFAPTLFDGYDALSLQPAAAFALSVVRRPSPEVATVHGGGWVASGPAADSRLPSPWLPRGLRLNSTEGAGEVQTPVHGPAAASLQVGERVWFRHAKAGELCERVNVLHLISGDRVVESVPTYRGSGHAFL